MKIRRIDLDDKVISQPHVELGLPPAEYDVTHAADHPLLRIASYVVVAVLTGLVFYFTYQIFLGDNALSGNEIIANALHDPMFWSAIAVGLFAQIIDGALGMAYGVTSAGKTYTMQGSADRPGLVPQALAHIFRVGAGNLCCC